jgi:hypothetical protein
MRKSKIGGPKLRPVHTKFTVSVLPDKGSDWPPDNTAQTATLHGA